MKALRDIGTILLLLFVTQNVLADYAPLHWNEEGVRIRQGWHIEWLRTGEMDENGNVIYGWSDTREGDRDVYAQLIAPNGQPQWNEDGALVISYRGRQEDPLLIPTGYGDYIFIWNDFRDDTAKGDMYAQKLDAQGIRQWDPDGVLVTEGDFDSPARFRIVADGTGGAMILWNDLRNGDSGDIYATRILGDGSIPAEWPVNGMEVTTAQGGQISITVDTDNAGGAIVGWMDDFVRPTQRDIYIQKVTIDAQLAWNSGDPVIVCSANGNQEAPKLCPDGNGGVYIVWTDKRIDTNGDLYFQRVLNDGTLHLPEENGRLLIAGDGRQEQARIVADGSDNAIILWMDSRSAPPGEELYDIYTQKIDSNGNLLWNSTGESVCTDPSAQTEARLNADGAGNAIVAWMDERDGNEIPRNNTFAQKINANGSMAWTTNGVPVCEAPLYQFNPLIRATADYSLIGWGDERSGSPGIWYQKLDAAGNAQLTVDGDTLIWGISGHAEKAALVKDNLGDVMVFFQDLRTGAEGYTAYVQVIDTLQGIVHLSQDGEPICPEVEFTYLRSQEWISACTDGETGAIAVWQDHRDSNIPSSQVYAQRVNHDGTLMWGNSGVQVSPYDYQQEMPQIVPDGEGGGIIAWSELTPNWDHQVATARIDGNGNTLWSVVAANDPLPAPIGVQVDILQDIEPDGFGGAYICYRSLDPYQSWNYNLFAEHIDASGNRLWEDSLIVVCNADLHQNNCKIITLPSGDAVFVWEDERSGLDADLYTQRINYDGESQWATNGSIVVEQPGDQFNVDLSIDEQGYVYITWEDFRDGLQMDIYNQKLDGNGQPQFQAGGLPVTAAEHYQTSPGILSDGFSGNYILWVDFRLGPNADIYGTYLDEDGELIGQTLQGWTYDWIQDGNIVNDEFHQQLHPILIDDYAHGAVTVWEDKRASGKEEVINLYAQRLNGYVVGIEPEAADRQPTTFRLHEPYPNPFNPAVQIRYDLIKADRVHLAVYDIQGRLVDVLADEMQTRGEKRITWNSGEIASGLYIIRLNIGERSAQQKVIFMK